MGKLDELRQIIREELKAALKEELPKLLGEAKKPAMIDPKKNLQEQVKSKIPGTLNTAPPKINMFGGGNPMASLLNETAMDLASGTISFDSSDAPGFGVTGYADAPAGTVGGMLQSARPSMAHEMVQITEVPDFSALMNKMKQEGTI